MIELIKFDVASSKTAAVLLLVIAIGGCGSTYPKLSSDLSRTQPDFEYVIGPGDSMEVFVWGNEELTISDVLVKPDGKITTRLVENIDASGKTPSQLARDIETAYSTYVKSPVVSVILKSFVGLPSQQVRVVGEAVEPLSVPFRKHMTVLDLMVEVGGLTEFAAGNRAVIVRSFGGRQESYSLRLEDLLKDGDINANVSLFPGDIVIIPEAWF